MKDPAELVRRAQAGDVDAFGHLVAATQTMTYAVARSMLRHGLAEDAAQEAYLRAFRRPRDLDQPAGFITWLRRIAARARQAAQGDGKWPNNATSAPD
jgi:RNA polymerase sigma-70 factor, ECF subfamily